MSVLSTMLHVAAAAGAYQQGERHAGYGAAPPPAYPGARPPQPVPPHAGRAGDYGQARGAGGYAPPGSDFGAGADCATVPPRQLPPLWDLH